MKRIILLYVLPSLLIISVLFALFHSWRAYRIHDDALMVINRMNESFNYSGMYILTLGEMNTLMKEITGSGVPVNGSGQAPAEHCTIYVRPPGDLEMTGDITKLEIEVSKLEETEVLLALGGVAGAVAEAGFNNLMLLGFDARGKYNAVKDHPLSWWEGDVPEAATDSYVIVMYAWKASMESSDGAGPADTNS